MDLKVRAAGLSSKFQHRIHGALQILLEALRRVRDGGVFERSVIFRRGFGDIRDFLGIADIAQGCQLWASFALGKLV